MSPVPSADDPLGGEFEFTVRPQDLDDAGIFYFKVIKQERIKKISKNRPLRKYNSHCK